MAKEYRFIVVDDNENDRLLIGCSLRRKYPTAHVCSFPVAEKAIEHFQQWGADAVITDFQMPKMSGAELTAQLRKLTPALPIVVVSGCPDCRELGLLAGANSFLDKDALFSLPNLLQQLL